MVYAFAQVCNLLSLPGMYLTNILKPEDRRQKKAILISCPIILRESSTLVKGARILLLWSVPQKVMNTKECLSKVKQNKLSLLRSRTIGFVRI